MPSSFFEMWDKLDGWLYWGDIRVLTQLFFPKLPTTFLKCFCRVERQKYAGKKSRLNWGSNSKPPSHESDTLTTEPPGRGGKNGNTPLKVPIAAN